MIKKTFLFFIALLKTSIKSSISKRRAFIAESILMVISNLVFVLIWWIFFRQFKNIAGWDFHDVIILTIVGGAGNGLMQIFFGGVRNFSKVIRSGDLDPFMTQPKNILLHIASSKSLSKGWGHLMTAFTLIILERVFSPFTLFLVFIGVFCACLVFTSVNIIAHSFSFWTRTIEGVSKKYCDALFVFSLYPTNIYSGLLQVVMFTLIPAGVISYLPVELVRNFSWSKVLILLGSSTVFVGLAIIMFYMGLKRYESGNKFGLRL